MAKILVVEDEALICQLITQNLELVGHKTDIAMDGKSALEKILNYNFDLVLLDIMLPELSGFDIIKQIKHSVPVIFVSAKGQLHDKINGLELGAEDYIVKPFEMLELLARVQVILRRNSKLNYVFKYGDIIINFESRIVMKDNKQVELTMKEFDLLKTLILNRKIALSREQLLSLVWGFDYFGDTRTVDVHIQRLRKKLSWEEEIQTVYKIGYRLDITEEE